jgi:hypothetical protein
MARCEPSAEFGQIGLALNWSTQQFHRKRLLDIRRQASCANAGSIEEQSECLPSTKWISFSQLRTLIPSTTDQPPAAAAYRARSRIRVRSHVRAASLENLFDFWLRTSFIIVMAFCADVPLVKRREDPNAPTPSGGFDEG